MAMAHKADELERIDDVITVSYTHLRAHETVLDLVCRLLLEKKNHINHKLISIILFSTHLHKFSVTEHEPHQATQ